MLLIQNINKEQLGRTLSRLSAIRVGFLLLVLFAYMCVFIVSQSSAHVFNHVNHASNISSLSMMKVILFCLCDNLGLSSLCTVFDWAPNVFLQLIMRLCVTPNLMCSVEFGIGFYIKF